MASFGDSFLDMAEAMLGKHNAAPSFEVSTVPEESAKDSTPALKRIRSDEDTDISSSSSSSSHSDTQSDRHINTSDKMEQRNIVAVTPPKRRRRMMGNYSTMDAVLGLNHAMSKVSTSRIIETRRMMNCAHSNVDWSSEMRQPIASSSNLT